MSWNVSWTDKKNESVIRTSQEPGLEHAPTLVRAALAILIAAMPNGTVKVETWGHVDGQSGGAMIQVTGLTD
jgi:hypothetical protein